MKKRLLIIALLAAAGITVSGYSLKQHYDTSGTSFCNINDTLNCDVVNKSWASEIGGMPVATFGILGYSLLLLGSAWLLITKKFPTFVWGGMALASLLGLAFALFLTGVEIFSLQAYCILCLTSQAIILAVTILVWQIPAARQGLRAWFFSSGS